MVERLTEIICFHRKDCIDLASRTKLATKNVFATLIVSILVFPLQFINRYYMVHYLGITYLGITSLFANILSVLSLADLGIGTAIVFLMYKPLAEHDQKKITILMRYYRAIYRTIAIVIFILGLIIIPFLGFFLHSSINYPNVYLLFIIYLMGTVSSYLFSYNQSLLFADQRNHIYSWFNLVVCYIMIILQIITVKLFRSPLLYATMYVFTGFITNILISIYVNRHYHLNYRESNEKLSKEEFHELFSNVVGNMFLRISGVVVTGTDSMLLSTFTNVIQVGYYANYLTITNVIQQLMTKVVGAVTGSIGNYSVNQNRKEGEKLFYNLQFLNFLLLNLATLGILFASKDVISLWLGPTYILSTLNTFLIAFSFYLINYQMLGWNFVAVYGLAKYMKLVSVSEMIINFLASILFLKYFHLGITGILLGTICSTLLTVAWQDPFVIFRHGFRTSLGKYIRQYLRFLIILILEIIIIDSTVRLLEKNIVNLWYHLLVVILLILFTGIVLPLIFYINSDEEKFLFSLIKRIIGR